jgi:formiminoglutamase
VSASTLDAWRDGRVDAAEGPLARRWHQVMRSWPAATEAGCIVLNGFACDAGVARNQGRVGAAEGPTAIRRALVNMPVHAAGRLADAGDVACSGDALEAAQAELALRLAAQLRQSAFPLSLGGGHEIAVASFDGLAAHLEGDGVARIGVVNFDAHFDLRRADRPNSGTPFLQIADRCAARGWPFAYACLGISRYANTQALFERARALGVLWLDDETIDAPPVAAEALARFVADVDHVYLTVCLDVFPAAVAPGVSAPAARGVALSTVEPLVDAVVASGKLRLADVAEMNPRFDVDGRTATVAARLVARIANGVARGRVR